jgi:pimeloyl-ACP methyl ester carboxylesterase
MTRSAMEMTQMHLVELSAGPIEYEDTQGPGPVVVLLHGIAMNGSVWRHVVAELRSDFRCVVPTLPLGGHRLPVKPEFDLSPAGVSALIGEFLEALDLRDVTLVENDTGRAQTFAGTRPARVRRLVLASCEAFDNYPPGLPGKTVALAAKIPGGLNALVQPLRLRCLRRLPMALGLMTKRKVPHHITDAWLAPLLEQRLIRRDLTRYLRAVRKHDMLDAARALPTFTKPALVVWAEDDRVMPIHTGRRLASTLGAEFVTISDSRTLIPEDQPLEFSRVIREFIAKHPESGDHDYAREGSCRDLV